MEFELEYRGTTLVLVVHVGIIRIGDSRMGERRVERRVASYRFGHGRHRRGKVVFGFFIRVDYFARRGVDDVIVFVTVLFELHVEYRFAAFVLVVHVRIIRIGDSRVGKRRVERSLRSYGAAYVGYSGRAYVTGVFSVDRDERARRGVDFHIEKYAVFYEFHFVYGFAVLAFGFARDIGYVGFGKPLRGESDAFRLSGGDGSV